MQVRKAYNFKHWKPITHMDHVKKGRFLEVYQNLPLGERRNTILVLEDDKKRNEKSPISWDVAFLEIDQETKIGEIILNKLIHLKLI